jgi:flagellin-like protein
MKNHRKSKRALSPVVASIILIAVTVAVSIAVAAWMGALTIGFMGTEELKIVNIEFTGTTSTDKAMEILVRNAGSSAVTTEDVYVASGMIDTPSGVGTIEPGASQTITVAYNWAAGTGYQVKVVSTKGNPFVYTATAPS